MTESSASAPLFGGELPPDVDVVVIGGGIAGTAAAYHLAERGVKTLLVERDRIGSGATAAAVGVLSPPMRQPFHETVHFRGEDTARRIWTFALRSVAGLGELLTSRGDAPAAALDLSGGYLLAEAHTLHEVEASHRALERAGLPVEWLTSEQVRDLTHGRCFHGGYRIEGGGGVDARAAAVSLAGAARDAGATVLEGVAVSATRRSDGSIVCETGSGEVKAGMVVYATHVESRRFSAFAGDEIVPIRGQGMVVGGKGRPPFRGAFATHWKLNVWRSDPEGRAVLGGWRHDAWDRSYWKLKPQVDEHLQSDILGWFERSFPERAPITVERRWSGIFGWTADYLPLVGPLPGRVGELVISGFSGGGLPFAFESGRLIASIVTEGAPVEGADLFNPRRFST